MISIAILAHHATSPIMLTNQKLIFFVMQWWYLVPLLKSSPHPLSLSLSFSLSHTHTHTHTQTSIWWNKFLLGQSVATLATHHVSYIQEITSNLSRVACIFILTHTKYHLYVHTQWYANITYTNTNTYTNTRACAHKELYTIQTFFYLYFSIFFISSLSFVLCLMIVIYKTSWNLRLPTSFHAVKYI